MHHHSVFNSIDRFTLIMGSLLIIIFLFSIYVTIKYRSHEHYKKSRLNVFFSILGSVAIIFVGTNILLSSLNFESAQRISRHAKTKEAIERFWLYPNQLLETSKFIRPEFRASFFMNNPEMYQQMLATKGKALTIDAIAQEQFISNVILQVWEDCLMVRDYDSTPLKFWLRTFITWAQSPYFREYYKVIQDSYMESTRTLAKLLFEYADKIPVPVKNTDIYIITVDEMMKDKRFHTLTKSLK